MDSIQNKVLHRKDQQLISSTKELFNDFHIINTPKQFSVVKFETRVARNSKCVFSFVFSKLMHCMLILNCKKMIWN